MNSKIKNILLFFIIAVLLAGNGVTLYILLLNKNNKNKNGREGENSNIVSGSLNSESNSNIISVAWNEWPVDASWWSLFDYNTMSDALKEYDAKNGYQTNIDQYIKSFKVFKVGRVNSGKYTGMDLYNVNFTPEGPSFRDELYRVIVENDGKLISLAKYSDKIYEPISDIIKEDATTTIANLETPQNLKIEGSSIELLKSSEEPFRWMTSYDNPEKMYLYDSNNYVYKSRDNGCFLIKAVDGTARTYYFDKDFLKSNSDNLLELPVKPGQITWSDGGKNTSGYQVRGVGGCGQVGCYNYPSYLNKTFKPVIRDQVFKQVGMIESYPLYEFKSLDTIFNYSDNGTPATIKPRDILQNVYDQYYPGYDEKSGKNNDKIPYEDFLKNHPLVYWQDPFGDYVEFKDAGFVPAVECGKPVIYLYPEKKTDVSVNVAPTGGFSLTEPVYNDGWKVSANPNGEIYNYSDQKTYPYLFWEGRGLYYERPAEGFVVKKADIKNFLETKLIQLGLIKNEYDEFIDFWLPKMQEKNYYFITFVPQNQFDKLAPLSVNPQPDTVIRVFMDYEGLDQPMSVGPQNILTPKRIGFTVVEWGGALHK